ncbi:hypothetical protein [Scytonema sp. NUACC26]|uniref:hypothetical protein n=1 Tax=Scytonema sp. NUACC26 TaxID=3140176 RepID=UPI0034DBFB4E
MPFQKNNQFRMRPHGKIPMDKQPLCLKVPTGVREQLKTIPNWQERLREFINELIAESRS